MGFRFWRRIKIAPGLTLNVSKSGPSLSIGPRGAKFTIGPGGQRATVGLTGSGLFYSKKFTQSHQTKTYNHHVSHANSTTDNLDNHHDEYDLSAEVNAIFKNMIAPPDEKPFVDGFKAFLKGNPRGALQHFQENEENVDSAFMIGAIYFASNEFEWAIKFFEKVIENKINLGRLFNSYRVLSIASFTCWITQHCQVDVQADQRWATLFLAKSYQGLGRWQEAVDCLLAYQQTTTDDTILLLLVDILTSRSPHNSDDIKDVLRLTENIVDDSNIHTGILLCRAKALHLSGLPSEAFDLLKKMIEQLRVDKFERNDIKKYPSLLEAIYMELGVVAEALGRVDEVRSCLDVIDKINAINDRIAPNEKGVADARYMAFAEETELTGSVKTEYDRVALLVRARLSANNAPVSKAPAKISTPGIRSVIQRIGSLFSSRAARQEHGSLAKTDQEKASNNHDEDDGVDEDLLEVAIQIIRETRRASVSLLQRRMKIGYNLAGRLMDKLEERGIIGPVHGSDPREILIDLDAQIPSDLQENNTINTDDIILKSHVIKAPMPAQAAASQPIDTNNLEQVARAMIRVDKVMKTGDQLQAMINQQIVNLGDHISVEVNECEYRFKVSSIDMQKQNVQIDPI